MGMHSYFRDEEITITDLNGLTDFLEKAKNGTYKEYEKNEFIGELYPYFKKGEKISFCIFDGWKIVSYWYDDFLLLLKDLAMFVEGYVSFDYETGDEKATITFAKGKCDVEIGTMEFKTFGIYSKCTLRREPFPENEELNKIRLAKAV